MLAILKVGNYQTSDSKSIAFKMSKKLKQEINNIGEK